MSEETQPPNPPQDPPQEFVTIRLPSKWDDRLVMSGHWMANASRISPQDRDKLWQAVLDKLREDFPQDPPPVPDPTPTP